MKFRGPLLGLVPLVLLAGCLGVSPEEARRRGLNVRGDDDDGDPTHNPGTPCLACHAADYNPGDDVFALAGTVYFHVEDPDSRGLAGVDVYARDARGREMHAITNRTGNFMFDVEGGPDGVGFRERSNGRTRLFFEPEYPIEVWIAQGGTEQRMRTPIRREGSCATCHDALPSATSIGRVFLMETP
ncbi:MAG: hypothetical protein H6719_34000 [Sandaracinaceae bacterium]|nr:hypothetical protein [Sandaracinaceae bacterium]